MPNTLPFGTQFSPNQIELPQLLQLIIDNEGDDTAPLITAIVDTFFSTNATEQQRNMAGNCKNSLVSYGILENGGGVRITAFGRQLHEITDETEQCETLVKHILKNLNGMMLIEEEKVQDHNAQETAARTKERSLQETMLDIKRKYGKNAILKGMNLEEGATAKKRNQQIGGHQQ